MYDSDDLVHRIFAAIRAKMNLPADIPLSACAPPAFVPSHVSPQDAATEAARAFRAKLARVLENA